MTPRLFSCALLYAYYPLYATSFILLDVICNFILSKRNSFKNDFPNNSASAVAGLVAPLWMVKEAEIAKWRDKSPGMD